MPTSAEELHWGRLSTAPRPEPGQQRLYIDLDVCAAGRCEHCELECSYFYHPGNVGIVSVAELATYALVCRRCEQPHCVASCPVNALEQQMDKERLLVRHALRCVGCGSCSHACPYGTIYPENVPLLVHICDYCLGRRDRAGEPRCIASCPHGALALRPADGELEDGTSLVGDNLIVHSTHWIREKA
jgi:Fe-S-cluster-containing dehydrogenase component